MYNWQTDGIISWRDAYYNGNPDLLLSVSTTEWDNLYAEFSGSWSLFGIVKSLLDRIAAIPTGRYWLNPVLDSTILTAPLTPSDGNRYLLNGTGVGDWAGHSNCIAEYDSGTLSWLYYEDGGTSPYDLSDGASVWDETNNTYWVFNNDPSPQWIQCGGTTLEKIIQVTDSTYDINNLTHRGTTFIGAPVSGTMLFVLPNCAEGLWYRIVKATSSEDGTYVDIQVQKSDWACINVPSKSLVLDQLVPTVPSQQYREIRLTEKFDYIDILGTAYGWSVVGGVAVFRDQSPTDADTAQAGDATHLTLALSADEYDDTYTGRLLVVTRGTCLGQIRKIVDYVGSTRVATVEPAWTGGPPDNSSKYDMITYGAYALGVGELGTAYMVVDQDAYSGYSDLLDNPDFPTLSRYLGRNTANTWGALLFGNEGHVEIGAKYATLFGKGSRAMMDGQMVFGSIPAVGNNVQASRIYFGKLVSGEETGVYLPLGSGDGESRFLTEASKSYYVTFHCMGLQNTGGTPNLISWSGSVLAYTDTAGTILTLVPDSLNITETGNLGSPDLTFTVTAVNPYIDFIVDNNTLSTARFMGFADFVELSYDIYIYY